MPSIINFYNAPNLGFSLKVLILSVLFFVIIPSAGFAHSQSDEIPNWIKGVAGFWAEDKITDLEFIEALEFMIESKIIQVNDAMVAELEKENNKLMQKIESLESEKSQHTSVKPTQEINEIPDTTESDTNKEYYATGELEKETQYYEDGQRKWHKYYFKSGELKSEKQYDENGERVSEIRYDEDGNQIN